MMTLTTNQAAIEQRRRIADMMMQQGQEPLPTTTEAGGYVVPISPLAGLSKIAQSLTGAYIGKKADEHAAAIEQAHNDILSKIDFNAPDAPQKLAAAGMTKEAIALKMQQAKVQEGNKESFLLGYDANGNPFRFSKTKGTGGSVPDEITGKMLTGSALYSPEAVASRERAKQLEHISNVELPTGAKQIMSNYQAMGVQPVVNGIAQVESSNNPNAANPLPGSTSKGLYGFTDATRADAGLTGATPEQETAVMNELHKARMERYKGNEDLAILSHNIGITGADEVATGKRQLTPENIAYINKVRNGAVIGQTPAQKEESLLSSKIALDKAQQQNAIDAAAQKTLNAQTIEQQNPIKIKAKNDVNALLDRLETHYNELDKANAIPNPDKDILSNLEASAGASSPGQYLANKFGSKAQSERNSIKAIKTSLLGPIMKASGMTGSQINSDAELKNFMEMLTNPQVDIKTVKEQIQGLRNQYGNPVQANDISITKVINGKTYTKINGEWHEGE